MTRENMATSSTHRKLNCKVTLLDDGVQVHQLSRKALASELYSLVFSNLKLVETDYFGLEYTSPKSNVQEWLDKEKTILSQISSSGQGRELTFKLKVKLYTSEPSLLEHDLTRYYFSLQIKQDLMSGRLTCSENTAAILAAYIVQSELGDFYYQANDHDYLKSIKLLPNQTDELEDEIAEYHKSLRGLSVVEAESRMLDVARKSEMYGVVPYQCQNSEGLSVHLAVTHTGVHTIVNNIKSTSYIWVKIRKLGFKRKKFLIKLFPGEHKLKADNVAEFTFQSRDAAKAFWKLSIEHHSFFRKLEIKPVRRTRHPLLSRGSSFRYNGRTQTQLVEQMKQKWGQSTFDRSMSLRSFSTTSAHRLGKAATFPNKQELGVMTLDRARFTKVGDNLTVPSVSQATLESRYSGCYETTPQSQPPEKTPLAASHSLSTISSFTKSTGKFDIKTSSTFLPRQDGERDTTRDSLAVVEDNRVELERLVEQINSDLSSAQKAKEAEEESNRKRNISTSSIERFLSSTAQPIIPPVQKHGYLLQVPQQTDIVSKVQPQDLTQSNVPSNTSSDPTLTSPQPPTVTYTMTDEETLEILLTENAKDTTVTDLDVEVFNSDGKTPSPSDNNGSSHEKSQTFTVTAEVNVHDVTMNDELDSASQKADDTLALFLDEGSAPGPSLQNRIEEIKKDTESPLKPESEAAHADVIVLSSPDSGDEDLVFRSGLEISLPPHVRRGRTRSRQEEMADLEGLSQLAEQVLRTNEENQMRQQSQELSELATQVLDFCSDAKEPQPAQLSDLSDLLAHYDAIKQQQQAFQRQRMQLTNGHSTCVINETIADTISHTEVSTQPPSVKATRKPLIRPALPVLPISKERLLSWSTDESRSRLANSDMRTLDDRRAMADSGIDMNGSTPAASISNARQSSSDGYSSESEDSAHTIASPSSVVSSALAS